MAELFAGNEALFRGLQVHDQWDWARRSPVIRLSFGAGGISSLATFDIRVRELLAVQQRRLGISLYRAQDKVHLPFVFSKTW